MTFEIKIMFSRVYFRLPKLPSSFPFCQENRMMSEVSSIVHAAVFMLFNAAQRYNSFPYNGCKSAIVHTRAVFLQEVSLFGLSLSCNIVPQTVRQAKLSAFSLLSW
eukprot:TRINITY_DN1864_c1_g1_i1.p1 TRINITY_DN1864_c1_g1~~TRINITY_DN1864_c1_g1_i1.p1  ORF type:complete len:106 (-),score=7.87 TRINITY_DN1864_c1_g1_i1:380-697(-)